MNEWRREGRKEGMMEGWPENGCKGGKKDIRKKIKKEGIMEETVKLRENRRKYTGRKGKWKEEKKEGTI